jgi:hypothetical protein
VGDVDQLIALERNLCPGCVDCRRWRLAEYAVVGMYAATDGVNVRVEVDTIE